MRDVFLRSGKWRWSINAEDTLRGRSLELIDPAAPRNRMTVPLEPSPRHLDPEEIAELARDPEIRLWTDEYGVPWRITRVGPDTFYPQPVDDSYLVFDSTRNYAGIVHVDPSSRLGDLNDDELRHYRDHMRDFGGRRRSFRHPPANNLA